MKKGWPCPSRIGSAQRGAEAQPRCKDEGFLILCDFAMGDPEDDEEEEEKKKSEDEDDEEDDGEEEEETWQVLRWCQSSSSFHFLILL